MHRTGHILLLHHSEGERMRYVADWFNAGLLVEDKLLYVDVAGWGVDQLSAGLAGRGFNVDRVLVDKRLEFVTLEDMLTVDVEGGLVDRALSDESHHGVRMAVRGDSGAQTIGRAAYEQVEKSLARLCRTRRVSVLCQYDGRTTRGPALELTLDLHPDWVYESDLSVLRRGRVIRIEGMVDSLDGDVLRRSLERMTRDLSTTSVLALDLRQVDSLTPGAFRALVEGTRAYRDSGGRVRCALPETDMGRLLTTTGTRNTLGFEVEQHT
jgi:hypothetical protein